MSNIFVSIVFCTLLLDQTDANQKTDRPITVAAEQQKQIDDAIKQLGSRRFAERQKAFRFLQNAGISAEPSLKNAAQSNDPEIRARVKQLLSDLRYGISPKTKPEIAALIRRYRDGTPKERDVAFDRLLKKQEFKILQRIIQLEEQPEIRRQLVERLFKDELVVDRFIELNAIRSLVDTIGRDADPRWRREMIARVLFSPRMLKALIDKEQLGTIEQFLLNEESETTRAELLSLLFQNQAALGTIITSGQVVAMEVEGENAVSELRRIMGATNPADADPGTIRADFATKLEENVVHGSDSEESAERELGLFFNN